MASKLSQEFGYTVVYVKDVVRSVEFYKKAFSFNVRRLDESLRWEKLENRHTTIVFTMLHQHETGRDKAPIEVCFVYSNVDAAYKTICDTVVVSKAVENGAVPVSEPEQKEWGQKVGYVRDLNGIVVRMGAMFNHPSRT